VPDEFVGYAVTYAKAVTPLTTGVCLKKPWKRKSESLRFTQRFVTLLGLRYAAYASSWMAATQ